MMLCIIVTLQEHIKDPRKHVRRAGDSWEYSIGCTQTALGTKRARQSGKARSALRVPYLQRKLTITIRHGNGPNPVTSHHNRHGMASNGMHDSRGKAPEEGACCRWPQPGCLKPARWPSCSCVAPQGVEETHRAEKKREEQSRLGRWRKDNTTTR